ncbi:hypothetical protein Tco_1302369 [Tanacetum coccineum]
MDDLNITMEEYIRLKKENTRRHGRTFNWQTATFKKIKNYKDEDDYFIDFKTEFPTIVFDKLTAIPSEPTMISVNDLKTDSKNDNNNMPSSPNPTIDYIDDLDFFKEFENEFSAIVYNDARTSKSDYLTKPILNPQHINEFNLKDETSLSEYDEENVSRFNDLFNIIHPDDSKLEKDNDDNDIDIEQSLEGNKITHGSNGLSETNMAPLPAANQRHHWLRYQIEEYNEGIRHSYEQRLKTIWSRPVNRVHVLDFEGLTPEMRQDLAVRLRMVYSGEGQQVFVSHAWRRLFGIRAPLLGGVRRRMTWRQFILALGLRTDQEMAEAGFGAYWDGSDTLIPDKGDLRDYWIEISSDREFLGPAPSYAPEKVTGVDLFYLRSMDRETTNVPHLLTQYLFRHAEGRKSGARLSGGHFIGHLAMHFGLVSDEGLRGLQVVTRELPLIDLHELGRINIYTRYGDTWAWVAQGPERQQAAATGAHEANKAGLAAEEVTPEIPAPAQAPPPPPPAPQTQTMSQRIERVEEEIHDLRRDVLMDASGLTYQAFDRTLVGSSQIPYQRHVRPRTGDASTSAAPHTDAQLNP